MRDQQLLLFKCLADASRIKIINHLYKGPMYVELLAEVLDLKPATISFHLKKLEEAGLVTSEKQQYYMVYSLNKSILEQRLDDLIVVDEIDVEKEREEQYRQKVIHRFFEYGKLKNIPVQQKKQRIILEEIANLFEIGKVYSEKEVNLIIADVHDDFCTLRRALISEKLMTRENGNYQLLGDTI